MKSRARSAGVDGDVSDACYDESMMEDDEGGDDKRKDEDEDRREGLGRAQGRGGRCRW